MKYKQRGYRETEQTKKTDRKEPRPPKTPEERQLRHMMERSATLVLRCHQCNSVARDAEGIIKPSICGSCSAPLHCCRNCAHFDTGARWECRETIPQQIQDKTSANDCPQFKANTVLDATGRRSGAPGAPGAASNARAAFDSLFKKK